MLVDSEAVVETCQECGGALSAGAAEAPPCLCDLAPVPEGHVPATKGTADEAKALKCPSCGGFLDQGARRCAYCAVELASVRCWRCFDLSFAGTMACAQCGATLGLEGDLGPTEHRCPGCDGDVLHLIDVGEHRIEECAACGGVFVEQTTLSRLVRERAVESEATVVDRPRTQRDKAVAEVTYRACPQCQKVMMRKNFGRSSGVIVDVCHSHGTWFDPDELTHVLEFVASGGLRHRPEHEEQARELAARRQRALSPSSVTVHAPSSPTVETVGESVVLGTAALVTALIDFFDA